MSKKVILFSSVAFMALAAYGISFNWYAISEKSAVTFDLPNGGANGTLGDLKAEIVFNKEKPEQSSIKASVAIATINTGDVGRDNHLCAEDFFNAKKFPRIEFTSQSIIKTDTGYLAIGMLAIKDSIKLVDIPFKFIEEAGITLFDGNLSILASDYGVMKPSPTRKDHVVIHLKVPVTSKQ